MTLQQYLSTIPCLPLPSGNLQTPLPSIPWCYLSISSFIFLSFLLLPLSPAELSSPCPRILRCGHTIWVSAALPWLGDHHALQLHSAIGLFVITFVLSGPISILYLVMVVSRRSTWTPASSSTEQPRVCHNHKPQSTPTRRGREKGQNFNTRKTNKQTHTWEAHRPATPSPSEAITTPKKMKKHEDKEQGKRYSKEWKGFDRHHCVSGISYFNPKMIKQMLECSKMQHTVHTWKSDIKSWRNTGIWRQGYRWSHIIQMVYRTV